jgi:hypothetical protein
MTEVEWLNCPDFRRMLRCLCEQFGLDGELQRRRKLRLLACGLARTVWELVPEGACRETVVACEEFAEGRVDENQMTRLWEQMETDQEHYWPSHWYDLIKLRQALRSNKWGKNASRLSQAASEVRRAYIWWLKDAGASTEIRKAEDAELKRKHIALIHHIFGNPFRSVMLNPAWDTQIVKQLATTIYGERAFERLPFLADALEDAGCDNQDILSHLRQPDVHTRGCWCLDLLLGKE